MSTIDVSRNNEQDESEPQKIEMDEMREILTSIANEMQRFHDSTLESESESTLPRLREKQNVFGELLKCKSKIKSKRVCIKKLRKNLETACSVAKIVTNAKEKESGYLRESLGSAQNECSDLMAKYRTKEHIINDLTKENNILNNKLDNVASFIRLGYEELQKIRQEPIEEVSVLEQLRHLIVCCGQYYADYCNEHEECLHLKQRNNFLINKSQILENSIDALSQQLKTLQYRNFRLQKENDVIKDKTTKLQQNGLGVAISQVRCKSSVKNSFSDESNDVESKKESEIFEYKLDYENGVDLSPHLTMVKKLLNCQDALLKDLKSLSDEFLNS